MNPTDAGWLATKFEFFDHKKVYRSIAVGDVLDPAKLGYSYPPGAGLAVPGRPRRSEVTYDSTTHRLRISDQLRDKILGPGALDATRFLVVEGTSLPTDPGVYYIYAGSPPANRSAAAPNYLGFLTRLASGHIHDAKSRLMLNASKVLAERASSPEGVQLTYVPAQSGSRAARLEFASVYLVER